MSGWIVRLLIALLVAAVPAAASAQSLPLWATLPDVPALPTPDRSGFVHIDGADVYYAAFHRGGGSPVILLHGGFASSDSWGFEVPRLVGRHEVIVMDNRGHGRSSRSPAPLGYEQMASDVVAVMDQLHIRRASIVGLSDGGIIGLILAIRHPDLVDKLFAWGATFNTRADSTAPPDPAMNGMGARFMARMETQYRALSPTPDEFPALRAALDRLYAAEPNLTAAELGGIKAPTVVADGEHEQFIARDHTETLARLIPGASLVILPNVSHGGPQQNPVAFHQALAALLDGGASGGD
jgi:pimeloyl-ACP methyl ester carboxylesterase